MLVEMLIGEDVFNRTDRLVVIPVACNGTNTTEMHIRVAAKTDWPQLRNTSFLRLGSLSLHEVEDSLYYAAACFQYVNDACRFFQQALTECLNALPVKAEEVIALVLPAVSQAQLDLILQSVQQAQPRVVVLIPEPPAPAGQAGFEYPSEFRERPVWEEV